MFSYDVACQLLGFYFCYQFLIWVFAYLMFESVTAYQMVSSAFVKWMLNCIVRYQMFTFGIPIKH